MFHEGSSRSRLLLLPGQSHFKIWNSLCSSALIFFSLLNSARLIRDWGLPIFLSHSCSSRTLAVGPWICPWTVPWLVFWTQPTSPSLLASP